MRLIADKIEQSDSKRSRNSKSDILDPESFLNLRQQPVNGEGDDQEEVQAQECEHVTKSVADVSGQLAENHPQSPVIRYHRRWTYVPESSFEVVGYYCGDFPDDIALDVPYTAYYVGHRVDDAVRNDLKKGMLIMDLWRGM